MASEAKRFRIYINDFGSWYGPTFICESGARGVEWSPKMKFGDYDIFSNTDYCFYFTSISDAVEMRNQLANYGHKATIFQEVRDGE